MAFPTSGVLDNFNRASLGTGWTNAVIPGVSSSCTIHGSTVFGAGSPNAHCDAYWNASTFGPDCEVFADVAAAPVNNGGWMILYLGLARIGAGTTDGYKLYYEVSSGTHSLRIYRVDNGSSTQISYAGLASAPTKIGLERVGSTLTSYWHNGTSWASAGTATDSTYSEAGYIGAGAYEYDDEFGPYSAARFDNFGGGSLASASFVPPRWLNSFQHVLR